MNPVTLSHPELTDVLTRVAPSGKEFGAARICRLLAANEGVLSARVNMVCSVSNISDLVAKTINPRIADLGLYVACTKPPYKILNKYQQPSGQMLWAFYRDQAANDPVYELHPDVVELQDQIPELKDQDGSTPDDWAVSGAGSV